jgi:hypothetical protein
MLFLPLVAHAKKRIAPTSIGAKMQASDRMIAHSASPTWLKLGRCELTPQTLPARLEGQS